MNSFFLGDLVGAEFAAVGVVIKDGDGWGRSETDGRRGRLALCSDGSIRQPICRSNQAPIVVAFLIGI
jgi:hypothetical protein